jgi:hypothetical protein
MHRFSGVELPLHQINNLCHYSCCNAGDSPMKFITLKSRGGDYQVVASNVAWLRTAENGQTLVGMVGGAPILVTGSMEDVSGTILAEIAAAGDRRLG